MKWIKDIIAYGGQVIVAPLCNILCGAGVLLVLGAFVGYDKAEGFALPGEPNWFRIVVGAVLVALGVVVFVLTRPEAIPHARLDYEKGVTIKRGELTILIKSGAIERVQDATRNSAIVLPGNTTFADDCVMDKRSALGAFFIEHFPEKVSSLANCFKLALEGAGMKPGGNGQYAGGTTILLPAEFRKPAKVLVTASTLPLEGGGISSSPYIICKCVEGVFRRTADQRVDRIYMPILGSGHGGVERGLAMLFLVLGILHFSKRYHHVKKVNIVVHPEDVDSLNRSKELRQMVVL